MLRKRLEGFGFEPERDLNVLPALRDAHSEDPLVLDLEPGDLARVLYERYFLSYKPYEGDVLSALEALAIETGEEG
jgi:hypothetical protein